MTRHPVLLACLSLLSAAAAADIRQLIPEDVLYQIAEETSGEAAKRNLDTITLQHRMRASTQFESATQHILEQLKAYGLDEVDVLEYDADGKTMYGTQKSRPVWEVRSAQLWEVRKEQGKTVRVRKLGDWDSVPLSLAQDSLSGDVTTTLVDIGEGTDDADYSGKDIKGKLVLTSSQPEAIVDRAVGELGAAGIISYAPNQKSAWWKEDDINLTCHLDHPRPGANDNASGCVAILEVARTLASLIDDGIVPRPSRTIRFLWPAEIEGSIMYLSEHDDPSRIKANIHMDMVGGAPVTKSVFRISGGPYSVPSFIADLGHEIGHFVNDQTLRHADGEDVLFPLTAPEGGKEPQMALMEGLDMGSDHDVFFEGTWRIPGLYLHDWPDRYIHTNYDLAANIDPTKLKRAAFIGAVTAWYLADFSDDDVAGVMNLLQRNALSRSAGLAERRRMLPAIDAATTTRIHFSMERRKVHSVEAFADLPESHHQSAVAYLEKLQNLMATPEPKIMQRRDETVYARNADIEGPMHAFGYSFIEDKLNAETLAGLKLNSHSTAHGDSYMFTYEALNFVDGKRTVSDIRDWLVAEMGEVSVEDVAEYLAALESIGVVERQ